MEYLIFAGWVDDSIFNRRTNPENDEEMWKSNGSPASGGHQGGAFTTGRSRGPRQGNVPVPPPPAVKPRSQVRSQTSKFENHKKSLNLKFSYRIRNYIEMSSGPDLSTLDFDNLERKEVVACRLKVPDHEEL